MDVALLEPMDVLAGMNEGLAASAMLLPAYIVTRLQRSAFVESAERLPIPALWLLVLNSS
jgi:hypothetical protein